MRQAGILQLGIYTVVANVRLYRPILLDEVIIIYTYNNFR